MENQEVINYLLAHNDLKIIQRKDMFNFSLDTVLLSQFCTINKDVKNIVDFGTNNAAIPLLLSKRTPKKIIGIEIQDEAVDLARRNVELNDLNDQIEVVHGDIKDVVKELPKAQLIVCNTPFFKVGENSNLNDNKYLTIARHEIKIDLEGIISAAAYLLDNKGRFSIVHLSSLQTFFLLHYCNFHHHYVHIMVVRFLILFFLYTFLLLIRHVNLYSF